MECIKKEKKDRRGLIIQPGAVGDGILTLPLARLLRRHRHTREMAFDILGHPEKLGFLKGRSEIEQIIPLEGVNLHMLFGDSRSFTLEEGDQLIDFFRGYELIISFIKDDEGHFERNLAFTTMATHAADIVTLEMQPPRDYKGHVAGYFMEQFVRDLPHAQVTVMQEDMEGGFIFSREGDEEKGGEIVQNLGITAKNGLIAIHPGSGGKEKCWPLDNYRELAKKLGKQGLQPVMILGPVEKERWEEGVINDLSTQVPVIKEVALEEIAGLLSCCRGYVGNDCGITHLAGALGLATVAIFGPTNSNHWRPLGSKVRVCEAKQQAEPGWPGMVEVFEQLLEAI